MFTYRLRQEEENGITLYKLCDCNLSDEAYDDIKALISFLGGCWRQKDEAFVFAYDPTTLLHDMFHKYETNFFDKKNFTGFYQKKADFDVTLRTLPLAYRMWQEKTQFFPTPEKLAKQVVDWCDISDTDVVLEPSAGQGNLLKYIPKCEKVIAVEPDFGNCNIIKQYYGINAIGGTFEAVCATCDLSNVTRVVMNPPFSHFRDLKHVEMAYNILHEGGCLTAIISENNLYYEGVAVDNFKQFLSNVDYEMLDVPFGTFRFSGTMVYTKLLKIKK